MNSTSSVRLAIEITSANVIHFSLIFSAFFYIRIKHSKMYFLQGSFSAYLATTHTLDVSSYALFAWHAIFHVMESVIITSLFTKQIPGPGRTVSCAQPSLSLDSPGHSSPVGSTQNTGTELLCHRYKTNS
jgi:hypothetical protein